MYIHHTFIHTYKPFSPSRVSCMYMIPGLTTWWHWIAIQGTHPRESYFSHFEHFLLPVVLCLWWGPWDSPSVLVCLLLFRVALGHFTCTHTCAHTHTHSSCLAHSHALLSALSPLLVSFFPANNPTVPYTHKHAHLHALNLHMREMWYLSSFLLISLVPYYSVIFLDFSWLTVLGLFVSWVF